MSAADAAGALAAALVAAALARPLARVAARCGLVDPRPGAPVPERKRGQAPIPLAGGVVALVAAVAGALVAWRLGGSPVASLGPDARWSMAALLVALAVGLADDLRRGGFSAAPKLALQVAAAVVGGCAVAPRVAAMAPALEGAAALALGTGLVLVALELANTFDHADGLCGAVGLLGLALPAPFVAGALLGWLPSNTDRRPPLRPAPTSILGDGGAHLVGMALAVVPGAWPALLVPALDLARVVALRLRAGDRIWQGDRRHLGHRLASAGATPRAAALVALLLALPAVAGAHADDARLFAAGCAATALAYAATLHRVRVARGAAQARD